MCGKALAVDPNTHVVVIYHEQRGSYLGSRVTKCCRSCKVYEHYGYWTQEGKRHFNDDCLSNEFLLSSATTLNTRPSKTKELVSLGATQKLVVRTVFS